MKKVEFWILASNEDTASKNIRDYLLNSYPFKECTEDDPVIDHWKGKQSYILDFNELDPNVLPKEMSRSYSEKFNLRLMTTDERLIYLDKGKTEEQLEARYKADFMIVASRHKSKSGIPAILTHTTGNWNEQNEYGGSPNSVAKTSAVLLRYAYDSLLEVKRKNNLEWAADLEVDHHGPTELPCPLIFMELGSSQKNYGDKAGIKAVSWSIMKTSFKYFEYLVKTIRIDEFLKRHKKKGDQSLYDYIRGKTRTSDATVAVGFGGPHYARNFSRTYKKNLFTFISHIIPKYYALDLTAETVKMMIENTIETVNTFLIDWKGVKSKQRKYILGILEGFNIDVLKCKDLR